MPGAHELRTPSPPHPALQARIPINTTVNPAAGLFTATATPDSVALRGMFSRCANLLDSARTWNATFIGSITRQMQRSAALCYGPDSAGERAHAVRDRHRCSAWASSPCSARPRTLLACPADFPAVRDSFRFSIGWSPPSRPPPSPSTAPPPPPPIGGGGGDPVGKDESDPTSSTVGTTAIIVGSVLGFLGLVLLGVALFLYGATAAQHAGPNGGWMCWKHKGDVRRHE